MYWGRGAVLGCRGRVAAAAHGLGPRLDGLVDRLLGLGGLLAGEGRDDGLGLLGVVGAAGEGVAVVCGGRGRGAQGLRQGGLL